MNDRRRQVWTVVVGAIAGAAVVIVASAGLGGLVRTDRAPAVLDRPSPSPTSVMTPGTDDAEAHGWPGMSRNQPGTYSWSAPRCVPSPLFISECPIGWMHNGYGSGDVEVRVEVVPDLNEWHILDGDDGTTVTVAGHVATYHRTAARREQWTILDIDGTSIAITLTARPGTSEADLADAHTIIESMRTEPQDTDFGFRLVFELTNNDWDSG